MKTNSNYVATLDSRLLRYLDDKPMKLDARFTKLQAFRYLLENASDDIREVNFCGTRLICDAGQLVTSQRRLSKIWKWHHACVQNFLTDLVALGYITVVVVGNATVISLPVDFVEAADEDEDEIHPLARLLKLLQTEDADEVIRILYGELVDEVQSDKKSVGEQSKPHASDTKSHDADEKFRARLVALLTELNDLIETDDTILDTLAEIYFGIAENTNNNDC